MVVVDTGGGVLCRYLVAVASGSRPLIEVIVFRFDYRISESTGKGRHWVSLRGLDRRTSGYSL